MAPESASDVKFEIGHVLFIDIVGYSKLLINEQSEQIQKTKVRQNQRLQLHARARRESRHSQGDSNVTSGEFAAAMQRNATEAIVNVSRVMAPVQITLSLLCVEQKRQNGAA